MKEVWYQGKNEVLSGNLKKKYKSLEPILELMAPSRSVLDIGCNGGAVSMLSAKYGASKVVGIDKREYVINQARIGTKVWAKKGFLSDKSIISYHNGNLVDNLSLVDEADFLILVRVIYHLREEALTLFERIKNRDDMIILVQGNPRRAAKPEADKTAIGNKLAFSPAIASFLQSYNFVTTELKNEVVIAKHKNSSFDLDKIKARCTAR